jgi:hypothetical protein
MTDTSVPYAARHRAGLPINSAMAESAVKELVSARMAKSRQIAVVATGCSPSGPGSLRSAQRNVATSGATGLLARQSQKRQTVPRLRIGVGVRLNANLPHFCTLSFTSGAGCTRGVAPSRNGCSPRSVNASVSYVNSFPGLTLERQEGA